MAASFTFPHKVTEGIPPWTCSVYNCSTQMVAVHDGKLKKDKSTSVKKSCLAGEVAVFRTETSRSTQSSAWV